jgi:hypothetical protein
MDAPDGRKAASHGTWAAVAQKRLDCPEDGLLGPSARQVAARAGFIRRARRFGAICWLAGMAVLASPAAAIEFWDDRVEIHGFYEMQLRSIIEGFQWGKNSWDLTQWYHVLNLEVEANLAPQGFGPFDQFSFFGRVEVRYDCVWTRGCGIFSSADTYGDRARRLPERLLRGRRSGYTGVQFTGDQRRYRQFTSPAQLDYNLRDIPTPSREPVTFGYIPGPATLSTSAGVDGVLGTADDPFPYYTFGAFSPDKCKFGVQKKWGSEDLNGTQNLPHTPDCEIIPNAPIADRANPLSPIDFNPITGSFGGGTLPLRPAPKVPFGPRKGRGEVAQGVWLPNYELAEMLRRDKFGSFDQNFSQDELSWNRGASQQDEKELKELYFDMELFDTRLWLRIGKQNIVWGKTELFRTTDQFNPQDLALASLPTLEESRVALWALRGIWSFYDRGPLEDIRLEVAMTYDEFEPNDLGRCGEPYTPLAVCAKTWGLQGHGAFQFGIAGEVRPPNPWNSWKGIEVGGRLEWRYDRFSFALTDFYGFDDSLYTDPLYSYSRNVDPLSGRPRHTMNTGPCRTGKEASCLKPENALTHHSVNQQAFHFVCANTIGFSNLDPNVCAITVLGSQNPAVPDEPQSPTLALFFSTMLSGQDPDATFPAPVTAGALLLEAAEYGPQEQAQIRKLTAGNNGFPNGARTPMVPLVVDPSDGPITDTGDPIQNFFAANALSPVLTDEQEALLGCGPFYDTNCDLDGIDLMNAEGSALIQSWSVFDGTFGPGNWLTTDTSRAQPGTTSFRGGPVCTRYEGGRTFILPGCRGPGDVHYDINVDGSTSGDDLLAAPVNYQRVHPFTGKRWVNEMAILSWNYQMTLVAVSSPEDPDHPLQDEFDARRPLRTDGCSFAAPQFCSGVRGISSLIRTKRSSIRAGGNGQFGRRDFLWAGGGDLAIRYEKRNVLGFAMDFAEDFSKSNWSFEFTWFEGVQFTDNNSLESVSKADTYNLSVSIDRPTFVNFLNSNRTLFFNTQWFFRWIDGYERGFVADGPFSMRATFSVSTGYFQDRLLPSATFVYDFASASGAGLARVTYRMTQNFTVSVGMAGFFGHYQTRPPRLFEWQLSNRVGRGAYKDFVENGFASIRERDEIYLRIRYAF